jgi:hypothetical protein
MKIEVNDSLCDEIVRASLEEHINIQYDYWCELKDRNSLYQYQVEDLIDAADSVVHMVEVYNYFALDGEKFDYFVEKVCT